MTTPEQIEAHYQKQLAQFNEAWTTQKALMQAEIDELKAQLKVMTQPDQKPPQRSEAIEKLIEVVENGRAILAPRELIAAARAELSAMRDELERWKTEAENLLWNLAGCDTYAMGYGLDGDHDKSAARPALESCRKMALHNVELRTQLAAQSAKITDLEEALSDKLRLVRELDAIWNGVPAEQASLCDMVAQIRKELLLLHDLEAQCGAMREAIGLLNEWGVVLPFMIRDRLNVALSSQAGADLLQRVQALRDALGWLLAFVGQAPQKDYAAFLSKHVPVGSFVSMDELESKLDECIGKGWSAYTDNDAVLSQSADTTRNV